MADLGHGISIAFSSGFFANVRGVRWDGMTRAAIDTSTYATTGARTKVPAELFDPGELTVDLLFVPATSPPIIAGGSETATVTWTDAGGTTWAATAFMTAFSIDGSNAEDRVLASATLTFGDDITIL